MDSVVKVGDLKQMLLRSEGEGLCFGWLVAYSSRAGEQIIIYNYCFLVTVKLTDN